MSNIYPLVSIVVPIFNVGKYVDKCLSSLRSQSYKNFEVLMVDDGSTDCSGKIIDKFANCDPRFHAIHTVNSGVSAARNTGIDSAVGRFVTFIDGDDWVENDYIEYLLAVQKATDSEMVICRNCFIGGDVNQTEDDIMSISSDDAVALLLSPDVALGAWNKLYDREFLNANRIRFIENFKAGEGLQFITLCASKAQRIGLGERRVYHYRTDNADSATSKADVANQGIGALNTMEYILQTLPLESRHAVDAAKWRLWSTYGYCLRQIIASKSKEEYPELYRKCIRERRIGAIYILRNGFCLREKIIALSVLMSPQIYCRIILKYKH